MLPHISMGLKSANVSPITHSSHNFKLWLNLATVYVLWGSTYAAISASGATLPPLGGMGARFVIAGLLMGAFALIRGRSLRVSRAELSAATQMGVMLLVAGIGAVSVAEQFIPSGYVSLLICGTPLYIAVFRTLNGDRPTRLSLAGVAVGLVGMFILVLMGNEPTENGDVDSVLFWSLVVMAGSLSWAYGSFRARRLTLPKDPLVLNTWEMFMGGAVLLLLSLISGERFDFDSVSAESWFGFIYLIIFGSLIGFSAFTWLISNAPISLVATYSFVNPVVAVGIGVLLLGESFGPNILFGGSVVLAGVALAVIAEKPAKPE